VRRREFFLFLFSFSHQTTNITALYLRVGLQTQTTLTRVDIYLQRT
jgi:hypothetical protein